ncbi:hypothetical protein [Streptomyces carpaticus]|uniref:DUF3558 domain-containing protein n=1 Tax=Streptomyces carpaticus TaxID=285558 RepID=A0ABV4ZQX3_9ACTN
MKGIDWPRCPGKDVLRRRALLAAAVLACLVAAWLWYVPEQERWERRVAELCGDAVPPAEVRSLIGNNTGDFRAGRDSEVGDSSRLTECRVGDIDIQVARLAHEDSGHAPLLRAFDGQGLPVPLGNGWTGYHTGAHTAVALECAGTAASVIVETSITRSAPSDDPQTRLQQAGFTTAVAERAARTWDCETVLGEPLTAVALPTTEELYEPVAEAAGTCAGLPVDGDDRVASVWETATDPDALWETCFLGTATGVPMYELRAYYGPSAQRKLLEYTDRYSARRPHEADTDAGPLGFYRGQAEGMNDAELWGSATCGGRRALFEVTVARDPRDGLGEPDTLWWSSHHISQALLSDFAQQAVERHDCTGLALP